MAERGGHRAVMSHSEGGQSDERGDLRRPWRGATRKTEGGEEAKEGETGEKGRSAASSV